MLLLVAFMSSTTTTLRDRMARRKAASLGVSSSSALASTAAVSSLPAVEKSKWLGSPKRTEVGGRTVLGPGRRVPKGFKPRLLEERHSMLPARFGKKDAAVVNEEKRRRRHHKEAILRGGGGNKAQDNSKNNSNNNNTGGFAPYDRTELYPKWLAQKPDFDRIFRMPMLPESVAIRKRPEDRHDEDKMALTRWLGTHSMFVHFSKFKRRALSSITRLQKFKKGDVICAHGGTRHKLFIVVDGAVQLLSPRLGSLGTLKQGDSVGRVESHSAMEKLAQGKKNNEYDVEMTAAAKETHVAVINRAEYREAMAEFREQETWDNIRFMQNKVTLFRDWSKSRLMLLSKTLETWNVEQGEIIVQQAQRSDYMFFVVDGQCAVQKRIRFSRDNLIPTATRGVFDTLTSETNMDVEVHIAKSGDYFGHHSFLTPESVERRRAEIEAEKTSKKKKFKNMRKKLAGAGIGGMGGGGMGGGMLGGGGMGLMSSLGASVQQLSTMNKEKAEIHALPRAATVIARTHCKLLVLSLEHFWKLMTYGDTIDQLMTHIKMFKTQDEVIRGFDEHKRRRCVWETAKDAVYNCGYGLDGMMKFEDANPRPMRITVSGDNFRGQGKMMGGHFDIPAAIMRKKRQRFKMTSRLKKAAKLGSLMARVSFFSLSSLCAVFSGVCVVRLFLIRPCCSTMSVQLCT